MISGEISFPSQVSELANLSTWLEHELPLQMDRKKRGHILLVAQEIATNAILHGNHSDPTKMVSVSLKIGDQHIVLTVTDEGTGSFSLPTKEEAATMHFLEEGGRGLKLGVSLADTVMQAGRSLQFTFSY